MKYLFVDTNNFMACALLTEAGHTPQTIDNLIDILKRDQAVLILPEIVEIEFVREVELELLKWKKEYESIKSRLGGAFPAHLMPNIAQIINSISQVYPKKDSSSRAAKANMKSLFSLKNVKRIPLSCEIFVRSYIRALSGQKPSKSNYCPECGEIRHRLDDDCMIFESILSIKELENNQLIFCSANKKHFAAQNNKNESKYLLHPDLISSFPKTTEVRYYIKLADALKAEFSKTIDRIEKRRIDAFLQWRDLAAQSAPCLARLVRELTPTLEGTRIEAMRAMNDVFRGQEEFNESLRKVIESLSILDKKK